MSAPGDNEKIEIIVPNAEIDIESGSNNFMGNESNKVKNKNSLQQSSAATLPSSNSNESMRSVAVGSPRKKSINSPGLLLRRNQKESRDDSELRKTPLLDADVVIKIHSKVIRARNLLMDINISLANSTTDIILKHKPVFDEEKRRLITFQSSIDKLYQNGLTTQFEQLTPINCHLCETTDFEEWNQLARDINNLTIKLRDVCSLNNLVENRMLTSTANNNINQTYSGGGGNIMDEIQGLINTFKSIKLSNMQIKILIMAVALVCCVGAMVIFWPSTVPAQDITENAK